MEFSGLRCGGWSAEGYDPQGWTITAVLPHWQTWFKHAAVARYLQVWGRITVAEFSRGVGSAMSRQSLAGMLGHLNAMRLVYKDGTGWRPVARGAAVYRAFPAWPESGVRRAQSLAWELQQARAPAGEPPAAGLALLLATCPFCGRQIKYLAREIAPQFCPYCTRRLRGNPDV